MSGRPEVPPPGDALEQWLAFVRPPEALVWETLSAAMPWTRPPGGHGRPSDETLRRTLSEAGMGGKAQDYVLAGPMINLMVYSPAELARNHGLAARAIQVAAEVDISGTHPSDISSRLG